MTILTNTPPHTPTTLKEEQTIFAAIEIGVYAQHILTTNPHPIYKKTTLQKLVKTKNETLHKLICDNLNLVKSIAKKYYNTNPVTENQDLIQEGTIGLIKAAQKYDYTLGYRFSTYATYWIYQSIDRYIQNNKNTIRIPIHVNEKIQKINQILKKHENPNRIKKSTLQKLAQQLDTTYEETIKLHQYMWMQPQELKTSDYENYNKIYLKKIITDENCNYNLENEILHLECKKIINNIFNELINCKKKSGHKITRNIEILQHRMGLIDGEPKTYHEISEKYSIARSRTEQITKTFIENLVQVFTENQLQEYIEIYQ